MNQGQWEKAKEIFERAITLSQGDGIRYIADACGGDPELLAELQCLLEEYHRAGSFLEPGCNSKHTTNEPLGHQSVFVTDQLVAERFQIVRFLGAGGMGEVYEAFDKRLEKPVALKVIRASIVSDGTIERLKREVRLAQEISHPNVCRVFDLEQHICNEIGTPVAVLTMEFLSGETLRASLQRQGHMNIEQARSIIIQIAEGLTALHKQDIVHRDLKPSNVILTAGTENGGRAVITDLGIAHVIGRNGRIRSSSSRDLTSSEQMMGTLDYMAPEQLTGDAITPATDTYAMGLLMFEMLLGRKPFADTNPFAAVCKRFKGPPSSLAAVGIGADFASLISSCLAVTPAERPQDGSALAEALQNRLTRRELGNFSAASTRLSIAVLPFVTKESDRDDEYFSSGLTEELTLLLTKIEGLRVIAHSSVNYFKRSGADMRRLARDLKINAFLTGTVRRREDVLRIVVQLIDDHQECLWAERFDRQMKDVFSIQEEIATTIAARLQMKLRPEGQQFVQHRTENIDAYNLFLKGRFFANKRTPNNLQKAREHFKLALQCDSQFAPALTALADCCVLQGVYGTHPPAEVFPFAKETVFKALTLAPQRGEAHCSAGCIQAIYDWDWTAAGRSFQRALELDPNNATAHHSYALYYLIPQGRFGKARSQINAALASDPLSMAINASAAVLSYFERRYDDAIHKSKEVLEMDPNFGMAYFFLGQAYEQKGLYEEAAAALERAVILTDRSAEALAWLGRASGLAGDSNKAHAVMEELNRLALTQYISPVLFAQLFLGLHQTQAALDHLEKACEAHAADLIWIAVRPGFDVLRSEPRFQEIRKRIGLPMNEATSPL